MKKNWNAFDVISDDLKNKFGNLENQTEDRNSSDLLKAIAHKDKLIDFDRTRFFFPFFISFISS